MDRDEWSPAKAARDGDFEYIPENQPDGFYIVSASPKGVFQEHEKLYETVVAEIAKVTPVVDKKRQVCDDFVEPNGVLYIEGGETPAAQFGAAKMCMFAFGAEFAFTTEICPCERDAEPGFPSGHPENGKAQFGAAQAALQFVADRRDGQKMEDDPAPKRRKQA